MMTASALEREIRHIHDLLFLRDLLADRGVDAEELRRYDAAIAAARESLAAAGRAAGLAVAA
jgi:hypothetical protein